MNIEIVSKYFILFIIYSFAGWVMETLWVSWCNKRLVDRGFLIGPYCPIYGFGALFIILLLNRFAYNPVLLFFMTIILCGILEYFASWCMEKIFKARWWDYSNKKFNLNGRICLRNLIAFGVMGLIVTYLINPYVQIWIDYLTDRQLRVIAFFLWTIFIMDFVLSTIVVYGFRTATEKINKEEKTDNTEQITKMVRELLTEKSIFHRRFINAYPSLEAIKLKMQEIKTKIEDVTNDAKDVVTEKVNDARDIVVEKVNGAKDVVVEKVSGAKDVMTERTEAIKNSFQTSTKNAKMHISLGKENLTKKFKGKINKYDDSKNN